MPIEANEMVTVVIPAYNAASTVTETLVSVSMQTHPHLDIVVVDDGSSDGTVETVRAYTKTDDRVRIVSQVNGGVAAARNRGIEEARSQYVAFVDADDLWRPTKIARQLRTMLAKGELTGLVYTWNTLIDEKSRIISHSDQPLHQGDVLGQLCYGNFVGNGSSPLIRKKLLTEIGGFDVSLRVRQAQGCEDWKLYLQIAERSHFGLVPDHLTGYRLTLQSMSGNISQMLRSDEIVRSEILQKYPEYEPQLAEGRLQYLDWLLRRDLRARNWANCWVAVNHMNVKERDMRSARRKIVRSFASVMRRSDWWMSSAKSTHSRGLYLPQMVHRLSTNQPHDAAAVTVQETSLNRPALGRRTW